MDGQHPLTCYSARMQDVPEVPVFSVARLRKATADAEVTQQAVAIRLGMSIRAVQKWYLGEGTPRGDKLVALAAFLERDPAWFYEAPIEEAA